VATMPPMLNLTQFRAKKKIKLNEAEHHGLDSQISN
jgi:hypothetical protein